MILLKKQVKIAAIIYILTIFQNSYSQYNTPDIPAPKQKSEFWEKVRFGGAFGLNIGSGFTDITLAPSAIYEVNEYFATGIGLQGSYIKVNPKNSELTGYKAYTYGGSYIALFNPLEEIQLSAEIEQLRINVNYDNGYIDNFWNTALFLGAGYRFENGAIGVRYNVLHDPDKSIYFEAFMPFVRVYF